MYITETRTGIDSHAELKLRVAYADLKELKPVSGFVKGHVVQPPKPATPLTVVKTSAINTDCEISSQPLQHVQPSALHTAFIKYEQNSLAIKLSNNPLASLTGLQEAVGSVMDDPVSLTAFACPHNLHFLLLKSVWLLLRLM